MEKQSGIYRILCQANDDYYYGSSDNLHLRWMGHKNPLKRNEHFNPRVQRVWNKYGESTFRFEIIELVEPAKLLEVEDVYLKAHVGKPHCMNILSDATMPPSRKGQKMSKDVKRRISETMKQKFEDGYEHPMLGTHHTQEHKDNISASQCEQNHWPNLINVNGEECEVSSANLFCKAHGLTHSVFSKLLHGKIRHHKGWHLKGTDLTLSQNDYKAQLAHPGAYPSVTSPTGDVYDNIINLKGFCRTHQLHSGRLKGVMIGKLKSHRGWLKSN